MLLSLKIDHLSKLNILFFALRYLSIQRHAVITMRGENLLREAPLSLCEVLVFHLGMH